jgi:hypothetical protein
VQATVMVPEKNQIGRMVSNKTTEDCVGSDTGLPEKGIETLIDIVLLLQSVEESPYIHAQDSPVWCCIKPVPGTSWLIAPVSALHGGK